MRSWNVYAAVAVTVALVSYGAVLGGRDDGAGPVAAATPTPATVDEAGGSGRERISRTQMGRRWPFTVDSGVLECRGPGAVTFTATADGPVYLVNDVARSLLGGVDVAEVHADHPDGLGLKVDMAPIVDRGLRLC